jgi:hypothetical protein
MTIRHVLLADSPAGRLVTSLRRSAAVQHEPNVSLFHTSFHPENVRDLPFEPMPPKPRARSVATVTVPTCYRCGEPGRVVPMTGAHWLEPQGDELISLTFRSDGRGPGDVHPGCEMPGAVHPALERGGGAG